MPELITVRQLGDTSIARVAGRNVVARSRSSPRSAVLIAARQISALHGWDRPAIREVSTGVWHAYPSSIAS